MSHINRRHVLKGASLLSGMFLFQGQDVLAKTLTKLAPDDLIKAQNWEEVRSLFHLRPHLINLHSGVSPTLKAVLQKMNEWDHEAQAYPMEGAGMLWSKLDKVKEMAARIGHCDPTHLAITSSTTEGVNIIISGLELNAEDEILYTDQEYPSIVEALTMKSRRSGVTLKKVTMGENIEDASEHVENLKANLSSKTKLLVISHMSCRQGEVYPIKEITKVMHDHGVEVLVDGAHAFGHVEVNFLDLGCDYYATCFHKWIAGPMGGGLLFCRPEKVKKIWPLFGTDVDNYSESMLKFENFYGYGVAAKASNVIAMELHEQIGMKKKQERLTYLRHYWMERVTNPKISFTTPWDKNRAAGMGSFRVQGMDAHELIKQIKKDHALALGSNGSGQRTQVRVTPNVFTTTFELDTLVNILNRL